MCHFSEILFGETRDSFKYKSGTLPLGKTKVKQTFNFIFAFFNITHGQRQKSIRHHLYQ